MHITKFVNYFFERIWNNTVVFFTYWGLLIQLLYYIGILKKYQESVLLLTITVSVIGAILTYIYPKKIILNNIEFIISGTNLQLMDLFLHQIPLIVLLLAYDPKIKPDNLLFGACILLLYTLIYNPVNVYNFKLKSNQNKRLDGPMINDPTFRYRVATATMILYFIIIIIAINLKIFT